jgi:hypothetical protein
MNKAYLQAAGIHRVQRDVFVNSNPHKAAPLKGIKQNTNRVYIPHITNILRMNQTLQVLTNLNIFVNMPTPFAGSPEANHAKARPSKSNRTERKALPKPTRTAGNPFGRTNAQTQKIQTENS